MKTHNGTAIRLSIENGKVLVGIRSDSIAPLVHAGLTCDQARRLATLLRQLARIAPTALDSAAVEAK